ncbi:DUF6284 family protein [Antribacter gilvus]|uniref:DUF6284 family protein n=1 Tax=Antribacter gilvus TaxID=2304675 RepID=UPI000F7984F1|nr:DUF6284 family protein [Antribacter gilvus]
MKSYTACQAIEGAEPSFADLAAIADEWPVIAAELAVVEAECRLAESPDELAVRAHRRAVSALDLVTRRVAPSATRVTVRRLAGTRSRSLAVVATAPVAAA